MPAARIVASGERTTPPFRFALLDPRPCGAAHAHNESVFAMSRTLGIEVTSAVLAARCHLGNIDPQHEGLNVKQAAIEAAIHWPLPREGALLATIRPDLDSLGAMAVLLVRSRGETISQAMQSRIAQIAIADRFDHGPWPGDRATQRDEHSVCRDLGIVGAVVADEAMAVADRVQFVAAWLVTGHLPHNAPRPALTNAQGGRSTMPNDYPVVSLHGARRIAFVESVHPGALRHAYRFAPVVVARNSAFSFRGAAPHVKYTIAQWCEGYVDCIGIARSLSTIEAGWGGSPNIVGSPQGSSSRLEVETVLGAVCAALAESSERAD